MESELLTHPNKHFVHELIMGLRHGFDMKLDTTPSITLECNNLLSARNDPQSVKKLLQSEVESGYMLGPFNDPPFDLYRVNPLGIAEGKYSKKKRLIIDCSSPHRRFGFVS